jgi:hypothetical protein
MGYSPTQEEEVAAEQLAQQEQMARMALGAPRAKRVSAVKMALLD